MIEALEAEDRRRPYRLTAVGATALKAHLAAQAASPRSACAASR